MSVTIQQMFDLLKENEKYLSQDAYSKLLDGLQSLTEGSQSDTSFSTDFIHDFLRDYEEYLSTDAHMKLLSGLPRSESNKVSLANQQPLFGGSTDGKLTKEAYLARCR
jgi:hypothetical protein